MAVISGDTYAERAIAGTLASRADPTRNTQPLNFKGAWAPTTAYSPNDMVTINGRTYIATSRFTSGASFSAANWSLLADKGNSELAYAERLSDFQAVASGNIVANTSYDLTGIAVSVTVGTRPIVIEVFLPGVYTTVAAATLSVWIVESSNANAIVQAANKYAPVGNKDSERRISVRLSPSAGVHTYKVQLRSDLVATNLVSVGNAVYPQYIQVMEV